MFRNHSGSQSHKVNPKLSTRLKEKHERIKQALVELAEDSAKKILIVVEGRKDVIALRSFGIEGPILAVKTGGKSYAQALQEIEETGATEIILLLDFDRRGKQGMAHLKGELERKKVKVNLTFWRAISALAGREIQCIESIPSYMETMERKTT